MDGSPLCPTIFDRDRAAIATAGSNQEIATGGIGATGQFAKQQSRAGHVPCGSFASEPCCRAPWPCPELLQNRTKKAPGGLARCKGPESVVIMTVADAVNAALNSQRQTLQPSLRTHSVAQRLQVLIPGFPIAISIGSGLDFKRQLLRSGPAF